jgi:hypothetical protein
MGIALRKLIQTLNITSRLISQLLGLAKRTKRCYMKSVPKHFNGPPRTVANGKPKVSAHCEFSSIKRQAPLGFCSVPTLEAPLYLTKVFSAE